MCFRNEHQLFQHFAPTALIIFPSVDEIKFIVENSQLIAKCPLEHLPMKLIYLLFAMLHSNKTNIPGDVRRLDTKKFYFLL